MREVLLFLAGCNKRTGVYLNINIQQTLRG